MNRARAMDERAAAAPSAPVRATNPNVGLLAYATACTLLVAALLLTSWPSYAYAIRGGVIPLYYYVIPGLLLIPIAFAHPQAPLRLLHEPMFWWFAAYVLLGLLWQLFQQNFDDAASSQWRLRVLMFFLFSTIAVLAGESRRTPVAVLIVCCVLLAGAFCWFDALRPFRFVPQNYELASEGRGAGLFINPNIAASFVAMGTIAALPWVPQHLRAMMLTAAVMCVAPTFSRGGFVLVAIAIVAAVLLGLLRRIQAVILLVALPVLFVGVNLSYEYLTAHSEDRNMRSVVQRLAFFQHTDEEDISIDLRRDAAARAWALFEKDPLFGAGLGETTSAGFVTGPHNMYVMLMAEQGIFGLALYLSLIVLLLGRGWRLMRSASTNEAADTGKATMIFALYIAANGFFSHNVLDEPQAMFLMAFLVAAGFHSPRAAVQAAAPTRRVPPRRRIRW